MKTKIQFIVALLFLASCSQDYSPKPLGYFRIHFDDKNYQELNLDCPFSFEIPEYTSIEKGANDCWINLNIPQHNTTIYLTYKPINGNLEQILEDSHKLAYDHSIKSDGISEQVFKNADEKVYGVLYDITGNSASNLQFFLTDSSNHFLRGAMYVNNIPNSDSLQPVKTFIKEDIQRLMESFSWN
jgi:gliding motility-associated lipoprotein GldD